MAIGVELDEVRIRVNGVTVLLLLLLLELQLLDELHLLLLLFREGLLLPLVLILLSQLRVTVGFHQRNAHYICLRIT